MHTYTPLYVYVGKILEKYVKNQSLALDNGITHDFDFLYSSVLSENKVISTFENCII